MPLYMWEMWDVTPVTHEHTDGRTVESRAVFSWSWIRKKHTHYLHIMSNHCWIIHHFGPTSITHPPISDPPTQTFTPHPPPPSALHSPPPAGRLQPHCLGARPINLMLSVWSGYCERKTWNEKENRAFPLDAWFLLLPSEQPKKQSLDQLAPIAGNGVINLHDLISLESWHPSLWR